MNPLQQYQSPDEILSHDLDEHWDFINAMRRVLYETNQPITDFVGGSGRIINGIPVKNAASLRVTVIKPKYQIQ